MRRWSYLLGLKRNLHLHIAVSFLQANKPSIARKNIISTVKVFFILMMNETLHANPNKLV